MGCCTPAPKSIVIETTVLRIEGETCNRCSATVDNARIAAEELKVILRPLGVEVALVEHAATMENLPDSNSVIINGKPIEEWLGATRVSTECESCGDLCGEEGVCCGAVSIDDEVHESYSVEHIREAAMSALGAVLSFARSCQPEEIRCCTDEADAAELRQQRRDARYLAHDA